MEVAAPAVPSDCVHSVPVPLTVGRLGIQPGRRHYGLALHEGTPAANAPAIAAAALGAAAAAIRPWRRCEGKRGRRAATRAAGDDLMFGMEEELTVSPQLVSHPLGPRRIGVLLLNIGTPASTSVEDVREYLSRFLADDRVIEIQPSWLKAILLQILLATRPSSSAENYRKIWDPVRGSPLLFHSQDLAKGLQRKLGSNYAVRIGMAYSEPFVSNALKELAASGVDEVALVPMFPHYASSTTGSILANAYRTAAEEYCTPFLKIVPPFYANKAYISAMTNLIAESVGPKGKDVDHVLFSFHGLPEAQCSRTDDTGNLCLKRPDCCACMTRANRNCYRAQCFESARLLAKELELEEGSWSIGFQSRLTLRGTIQWIRPYTDELIVNLAKDGVERLAIVAPSFTADCVETLEELGVTGREDFEEAGGKDLVLVPCLNSSEEWVQALAELVLEQLESEPRREAARGEMSRVPAATQSMPPVSTILPGELVRKNGKKPATV